MAQLNVGFIGFGNMGSAIAEGFVAARAVEPCCIFACARDFDALQQRTRAAGFVAFEHAQDVVEHADVIFICVKPAQVAEVLAPIAHLLGDKPVVSVAAGIDFDALDSMLPDGIAHLSCMPNTPVAVLHGVWLCESRHSLDDAQKKCIEELLSSCGAVEWIDAAHMGAAGVLSGCGPAFAAMFAEALADAGVKYGLTREQAYRLSAHTLAGTGALIAETDQTPAQVKDAVCSPGGTTIKGVAALEAHGLRNAAICAVDAILE